MRHEQLDRPQTFDLVDPSALATILPNPKPETAVPDVPASVGALLVGVYVMIVALFALTIANAGAGPFMIAVDLVFLAAFFSVPAIFLKQERKTRDRPSLLRFLDQGMQTYTGPVSGAGALVQMFVVPVLLAFAVLCIGIVAMVNL
ncbi:hypothetical protein G7076_07140 [Sphingomonas sp. HDW15A]|uniref:hypothetical protein n=1 Tax=Sphingomonas sp. HDW15A TaxID=2714942 RepID=UPI0014099FF3|nr:hypothetical protein [Sphingomonas sp. HDW15A]QIK96252.1 hypothetical protein G7076_07140 [Sphingomonas sp. HDW15A]